MCRLRVTRVLLLAAAALGVACASSAPPAPAASTARAPASSAHTDDECAALDLVCDPPPTRRVIRVCVGLDDCRARCTRGNADACLEAFVQGRGVQGKAVGQEMIERACRLGNAHACILTNDTDVRDPRTQHLPPPY